MLLKKNIFELLFENVFLFGNYLLSLQGYNLKNI